MVSVGEGEGLVIRDHIDIGGQIGQGMCSCLISRIAGHKGKRVRIRKGKSQDIVGRGVVKYRSLELKHFAHFSRSKWNQSRKIPL